MKGFKNLKMDLAAVRWNIVFLLVASIFFPLYLDSIIIFINYIPGISLSNDITISDRILFVTFIGIAWYSLETRGMKMELIKQNELMIEQNRPYIKMHLVGTKLNIENVGKDDAVDITVIYANDAKGKKTSSYHMLGAGKKMEIKLDQFKDWRNALILAEYHHPAVSIQKKYRQQIGILNEGGGRFTEKPLITQL